MRIDHIAIWVYNLEKMKSFYETFFDAIAGNLYHNPKKSFTSYFLSFHEGCRLELMHSPDISLNHYHGLTDNIGLAHFALSVGSKERVDALTSRLKKDGFSIVGDPRTTRDGYNESVVLDPENNRIEITA